MTVDGREQVERTAVDSAAVRRALRSDPHRPQYHFLPPRGWMNDPNGLIQWHGEYHLFYQHNPHAAYWGPMHWGHAASPDLVHWQDLPIALAPSPGGPDEDGCWSGSAVDADGVPTIVYTGVRGADQLPCLATSADGLRTWDKYPGNPVIPAPPEGLDLVAFRDHSVWREDDTWYMLIGSGIRDVGGTAFLYRSADLLSWEYLHPIYTGDKHTREPVWTGAMWECPSFFPLGDRHVLVVSVWDDATPRHTHYPVYFAGRYEDHKLIVEKQGELDHGDHFYAPQVFPDRSGRQLMFGWLWEEDPARQRKDLEWAGVMSLPRVLSLSADGTLLQEPAPELGALRADHRGWADVQLQSGSALRLDGAEGACVELVAEIDLGDAESVGLAVRQSPGGEEETLVRYDRDSRSLMVDRTRSSLKLGRDGEVHGGRLELSDGESLRLHVFLDRSVIEIFGNGRSCVSSRIHPTREDSLAISVFVNGGTAKLARLDSWQMRSIWTFDDEVAQ